MFRAGGTRIIQTPIQAPRANAYAERWVRTVRTECLDHLLILSRRHLNRVSPSTWSTTTGPGRIGGIDLGRPRDERVSCSPTAFLESTEETYSAA